MRVAMVTGPSSGIGRVTAKELARLGFHVVAAGRSEKRTQPVVDAIVEEGGSAEFLQIDLASLDSARRAALEFEKSGRTLDVLVNNAGIGSGKGLTADGFEIHFGVNHLGHFMLTSHLRRTFRPGTRIIQVSSEVHRRVSLIEFDSFTKPTRSFYGLDEYGASKVCNILFVRELARRCPEWNAYAVHPGLANTGIIPWYVRPFIGWRLLTPEQGADTVVWCATSEEDTGNSGLYYAHRSSMEPSATAADDEAASRLWEESERWCGVAPTTGH